MRRAVGPPCARQPDASLCVVLSIGREVRSDRSHEGRRVSERFLESSAAVQKNAQKGNLPPSAAIPLQDPEFSTPSLAHSLPPCAPVPSAPSVPEGHCYTPNAVYGPGFLCLPRVFTSPLAPSLPGACRHRLPLRRATRTALCRYPVPKPRVGGAPKGFSRNPLWRVS